MQTCPLCSKNNISLLKIEKKIKIHQCLDCEVGFLDKKSLEKQKKLKQNFKYSLKDYFQNKDRLEKRFGKLTKIILKFKNNGKLLDVGAGFGLLTSILYRLGKFKITVVEPENEAHFLRKIPKEIFKKNFSDFLKINKQKFDLILLIDVLEHLKNPKKSLLEIKKILNNNGFLVIQLPNYKSLMAKICKHWSWWMIEDHKYFFSPKSIKKLTKETGFQLIFFKTYEDFYDFKKNLDGNFLSFKNLWTRRILKGLFFLTFFPMYFLIRYFIWKLGYGGLIFLIAKKN